MLQNWFLLLPELILLGFFAVAWPVEFFRKEKTSKTFVTLAQFFLLLAMSCSILFYNKSAFPAFWQNTSFNTLFKTFAYLLAWAWFYLSSKWFLNKNRPSFKFYAFCFALLLGFDILAASASLLTLAIIVPIICFFYFQLILRHWDIERVKPAATAYAWCAVLFCLLLWGGAALIYCQTGSFEYAVIKDFFIQNKPYGILAYAAVLMILSCFMFLMAFAPFHTWFVAFISAGVLPVCGFITLIPPLIYLCALITLMRDCLSAFIDFTAPVLLGFSLFSLLLGALSAGKENNIRRLFAFLSIYSLGFSLSGLVGFSGGAVIASFAYTSIATLSFAGVYTVFLGIKSRGDYLSDLESITGFYQLRPYMSAALLVFMFSLIGLAPTLGFFGHLSVINTLISNEDWELTAVLFLGILLAAGACLRIIRTIYFAPLDNKYDRTDNAIYICLFINMIFVLISLINPSWLLRDALVIMGGLT